MKDQAAGTPPPLSSFERHRVTMMRFFCGAMTCRHQSEVSIAALIEKLGPDATVDDVKRKGYCSKCGSKEISVQPSWPVQVTGALRDAAPMPPPRSDRKEG